MKRAVLDANVLAPGFLSMSSVSARLLRAWRRQVYELVVSEHLLQELARTFNDPYFRRRISPERAERVVRLLRRSAHLTDLTVTVSGIATQPKDDLVLATALSAGAVYLGTRDKQLLKLGQYRNLRILHPADLLGILERTGDDAADPGAT